MSVRRWLGRLTQVRRSLVVSAVTVAIAGLVPVLSITAAQALGTGTGISYTLEGCRASAAVYGATGPFICLDSQYTTGNLGSGWNELDVVPGRVTVSAGNSDPGTYDFLVSVDRCSDSSDPCTATPGYDRLSGLTLNAESTGTCGNAVSGPETVYQDQLFRLVTITGQAASSTCVYDFYARLAFGSHGYPGASLHYHLKNDSHGTSGIGNRDISIPVKQIAPFIFSKTETASQGSAVVWTVDKTATSSVNFSDTCASTAGQTVTVQVSWSKTVTNGAITVDGKITIGNNAHRPLGILISDQLYDGAPPDSVANADGSPKVHDQSTAPFFPALTTSQYDDVWAPPANVALSYNDVASATINDPAFNDTFDLPDATASATVVTNPPDSGATAVVTDVERLTDTSDPASTTAATDYKFRVTNVTGASGTLTLPGPTTYSPGASATLTTGPLTWTSGSQSASGSVTFTKQVVPNNATTETATLHDTATIAPDGQSSTQSSASTAITAGAQVEIDISKTTTIAQNQDATFTFNAYAPGEDPANPAPDNQIAGSTTVKIPAGSTGPVVSDPGITGLAPNTAYLIDEPAVSPFPANSQPDVEVDLPNCSTTVTMVNTALPATAQVQKVTNPLLPATTWEFTLTGELNGSPVTDLADGDHETLSSVDANNGTYTPFTSNLDIDGATYTITETPVSHWDTTGVVGDVDGDSNPVSTDNGNSALSEGSSCSFTWTLADFSGSVFECTFTNTKESDVTVVKTQDGAAPTLQFPFRLCPGTSLTACGSASPPTGSVTLKTNNGEVPIGTLDFGYRVPGDYVLCELAVPAGWHSTLQDSPYNGTLDTTSGNVCLTFHLGAGADQTFTVDNSSPKGNALTIGYWKHWNSVNVGNSAGAGNPLMDTFLVAPYPPLYLGPFLVNSAATGVKVLSNPSMKYAENGLAAQLLAAKLNVRSGALTCTAINNAISHADALLNGLVPAYKGPVGSTVGNKYPTRSDWVATASTLDSYNNNTLC